MTDEISSGLLRRTHIAYFSMEIAIRPEIHTYAGGLGILAGDTMRSAADLEIPAVFVSLASRAGYFKQELSDDGRQLELPDPWQPEAWCKPLGAMVAISIAGRNVWIRPWLYLHQSEFGSAVPVLLLDTSLEQNDPLDRTITDSLYGDGDEYRLKQEMVLGIGGLRVLDALGFVIHTYHLNEGHAALLTLELMDRFRIPDEDRRPGEVLYDIAEVRERCVFTTHTPVDAGHDRFEYGLVAGLFEDFVDLRILRSLAGADKLNMTQLALNLSGYINGVARKHAETTARLFPGYRIHSITNGVHVGTWAHGAFASLFDRHIPHWKYEPELLVRVLQIPDDEIRDARCQAKTDLIQFVEERTGIRLDAALPILGSARRMTGYKRPLLLFQDLDRLCSIAGEQPFQIILAGKAHPRDEEGKSAIAILNRIRRQLADRLHCVILPDYDMEMAQRLVAGADIWLNTPLPPLEASGTSGMKAALNGALNLSVLDGWWLEACIEGVTGWSIGGDSAQADADSLYHKLGDIVLPLYHRRPDEWSRMVKHSVAMIAYYFNSARMMRRYAAEAYLR